MLSRDLSNPLGAVRMSFEEIKNCLVSTSQEGTEGFCEVAKWLTVCSHPCFLPRWSRMVQCTLWGLH